MHILEIQPSYFGEVCLAPSRIHSGRPDLKPTTDITLIDALRALADVGLLLGQSVRHAWA